MEKTNQEFIDSVDQETLYRHIAVDGEKWTLDTFLEVNMIDEEVTHISQEDAQRVIDLKVGESCHIELVEITRLD